MPSFHEGALPAGDVSVDDLALYTQRLAQVANLHDTSLWPERPSELGTALYGVGMAIHGFMLARGSHQGDRVLYAGWVEGDEIEALRPGYVYAGHYHMLEHVSAGVLWGEHPENVKGDSIGLQLPALQPFIDVPGVPFNARRQIGGQEQYISVIDRPDDAVAHREFFGVVQEVARYIVAAARQNPPISLDRMPPI